MNDDTLLYKNGKAQNVVPTNEAQNYAAALECDTRRDAEVLFRALQHANNRGTTTHHYAELERRWRDKLEDVEQGRRWF